MHFSPSSNKFKTTTPPEVVTHALKHTYTHACTSALHEYVPGPKALKMGLKGL